MKIELFSIGEITLKQKSPIGDVSLIKSHDVSIISSRGLVKKNLIPKNQYMAQRAKKAYLVCICQPEISFDLFYAVPSTEFSSNNIFFFNKRLQWQIINRFRGLRYVSLDHQTLRLVIFTDSSFVNNKDLIFQISYVICLTNVFNKINIIH